MLRVKIYLKSGQIVSFECTHAEFEYNSATLDFTGYKLSGISGFKKVSLVPSQISAYTIEDL